MEPQQWYQQQVAQYTAALSKLRGMTGSIAIARLISFLAFVYAAYTMFTNPNDTGTWVVVTLLLLAVFILFVRVALKLKDRKALLERLLFVNTNELAVLQNKLNEFDTGETIPEDATSYNQDYTGDLDIFGPSSLYHLINRTTTWHGATQLADLLRQPLSSKNEIEAHQQAVEQFSKQKELRQMITAQGLLQKEEAVDFYGLYSWIGQAGILHNQKWLAVLRWVLPAINIAFLLYYLSSDNYFPLVASVAVSWMVTGRFLKNINQQHVLISKKTAVLEQYASILSHFSQVDAGNAGLLQQHKQQASEAHAAIKKLSSLASFFDQRLNWLVLIFLNSLFLYDIQVLWSLEKWKQENSEEFEKWIATVGKIETLNSLATFAFNNPHYQYPQVANEGTFITATQMAHPLIPATERVANDCSFGLNEQLVLVTGSNMSGKTTFLRTLGVNLLLAQCGTPVCARKFSFTPMTICTSIRVSDSLQEHTSYFMAELKRLQEIVHILQEGEQPVLVLIDEILRGTNSEDKTHGSELFIKKLLQYRCLTLFATHDLALSRLEEELPGRVSNYCFESIIREDELIFDYQLQRGVAKNKNATFLMKKMEII